MASQIDRLIYNTRERLLSDDMNDEGALFHRAFSEGVMAGPLADLFGAATPASGVLGGGLTNPTGPPTSRVSISPFIAMLFDSPAPTTFDSEFTWMELKEDTLVELVASVPAGVNEERWVVIEALPNDVITSQQNRDQFDPATGVMITVLFDKRRASLPTIQVRNGVIATAPNIAVLPAGVTGAVPLAYVYIRNGDISFADERIVRCRPLLIGETMRSEQTALQPGKGDLMGGVAGGGLSSASPFTVGDTEILVTNDTRSMLGGLPARFYGSLDISNSTTIYETGIDFALNVTGNNLPVYLYLLAPPYPSGYDVLAPRELVFVHTEQASSGSDAVATPNAMTRLGVALGDARNCIPMVSLTAPEDVVTVSTVDHINNRGPHPSLTAGLVINSTGHSWGAGTTADSIYVGSIAHVTGGGGGLIGQEYVGNGEVRWHFTVADEDRPSRTYTATTGGFVDHHPFRQPGALVGDDDIAPDSADLAINHVLWQPAGASDTMDIRETTTVANNRDAMAMEDTVFTNNRLVLRTDPSVQTFQVDLVDVSTTAILRVETAGYIDRVLARR